MLIVKVNIMSKTIDKHIISDDIHIYKVANSTRWVARFKIGSQWLAKTTKERIISKAKIKAIQLQSEYKMKIAHDKPTVLMYLIKCTRL